MKTTGKVQKTANQKFNQVMRIVFSAVVGLGLISTTLSTPASYSSQRSHVESLVADETNITLLPEISTRQVEKALEYHAAEFVIAEMAQEKENLANDNCEDIEAEGTIQAEAFTTESEYHAADFVETEMRIENEYWINNQDFLEAAEAFTAMGSETEVAKYARKIIHESEPALEVEAWMTDENFFKAAEILTANGVENEILKYAEKQILCSRN